ncbi:MAG: energy transducer TonB [Propionivibrio sp.]|uniref:TonB family protein n=1 Tax=Propionivibrio sp. TaxID=2212460 RepID=UPI001A41D06D|nr:TonB family protein [Propionivibrio sp.]MBL8413399.1 energy transducer TonB [Propionivibrio sp.]
MLPSSRHTLVRALIFSVLIHAVLLWHGVILFPVRLEPPAATINVVMSRDPQGDPAKPVSLPVSKPLSEPVKPSSARIRNTGARPILVPVPPSTTLVEPPAQPVATGVAVRGGALSTAQPGPDEAREGVSADDLRQYRLSLAISARRFKRYPVLARERGWEGTAEVALNVNALLPVPEVVIVRSSGQAVLDQQALEMMTQAARATSLPQSLKGRDFRILLPVKFSLEGDQ